MGSNLGEVIHVDLALVGQGKISSLAAKVSQHDSNELKDKKISDLSREELINAEMRGLREHKRIYDRKIIRIMYDELKYSCRRK